MIAIILILGHVSAGPPNPRHHCEVIEINEWGVDCNTNIQLIAWHRVWNQDTKRHQFKADFYHVDPRLRAMTPRQFGDRWVISIPFRTGDVDVVSKGYYRTRTLYDIEVADRRNWGETPRSLSRWRK